MMMLTTSLPETKLQLTATLGATQFMAWFGVQNKAAVISSCFICICESILYKPGNLLLVISFSIQRWSKFLVQAWEELTE
jgi:hypothetical protein